MATPAPINNLSISTYMSGSRPIIVLHWTIYGLLNDDFIHIERSTNGTTWDGSFDAAPSWVYTSYNNWGQLGAVYATYTDGDGRNQGGAGAPLVAGQRYWYRIRNNNHSEWTGYADNNDTGVNIVAGAGFSGSNVTDLAVTYNSSLNAVVGTWTDLPDEAYYSIDKQQYFPTGDYWQAASMSFISLLPANTITFSDTSIIANTRYRYRIASATNGGIFGEFSSWVEIVTGLVSGLAAPSGLAAMMITTTHIDLSWTDNSSDETGFVVERAILDPASNSYAPWVTLTSTLAINTTTYSDTNGLIINNTYKYRVKAIRNTTSSVYSNEASASTSGAAGITAPSNLTGTYSSPSLTLHWIDNSINEIGFVLEKRIGSDVFITLATLGANITTYVDSNVVVGTTYSYRVKAITATASSLYSNTFTTNLTSQGGNGYGIGVWYGLSVYHHNFFVARNLLIRDNSMENNGLGNFNADLLVAPNVSIDNPQSENLMIRRGTTIYS